MRRRPKNPSSVTRLRYRDGKLVAGSQSALGVFMRGFILVFAVTFGLFGLLSAPASAQPVPPGSYLQSCQNVRDVAGWLKATCQDSRGRWVEATMAISWCTPGNDIANEDGRLVCKTRSGPSFGGPGGAPFGAERAPYGSYMGTCRDVRVTAGWLKATCQDSRGRWAESTTAVSWCSYGRDIANVDGRLTCR